MGDSVHIVRAKRPGGTVTVRFTPMLAEVVPGFRGFVEAMLAAEGVRWPGEVFMCMEGEQTPCGTDTAVMVFPEWFREEIRKSSERVRKNALFPFGLKRLLRGLASASIAQITAHYLDHYLPQERDTTDKLLNPMLRRHVRISGFLMLMTAGFLQLCLQVLLPGRIGKKARWRFRMMVRMIRGDEEKIKEAQAVLETLGVKEDWIGIARRARQAHASNIIPFPSPKQTPEDTASDGDNPDSGGDEE